MLLVFCAVEEGGWSLGDLFFQERQGFGIAFEFGLVAGLEFGPFRRVVREPFS